MDSFAKFLAIKPAWSALACVVPPCKTCGWHCHRRRPAHSLQNESGRVVVGRGAPVGCCRHSGSGECQCQARPAHYRRCQHHPAAAACTRWTSASQSWVICQHLQVVEHPAVALVTPDAEPALSKGVEPNIVVVLPEIVAGCPTRGVRL